MAVSGDTMFRFWLHFHPLLILLALLIPFTVAGALVHWLQCRPPLSGWMQKRAFAAPTFVAVSTLFALYAGFLLANAIGQKARALQAVENESAAMLMLGIDSEAAGGNGTAIRDAIRAYARSVGGRGMAAHAAGAAAARPPNRRC